MVLGLGTSITKNNSGWKACATRPCQVPGMAGRVIAGRRQAPWWSGREASKFQSMVREWGNPSIKLSTVPFSSITWTSKSSSWLPTHASPGTWCRPQCYFRWGKRPLFRYLLIRHLYLSGTWLDVELRMSIKKDIMCFKDTTCPNFAHYCSVTSQHNWGDL